MLYGAMNFPIRPLLNEIRAIGSLGFDYLELAMDPPEAHYHRLEAQRDVIKEALNQYNLALICHLPTFIHTADLTDTIREASRQEMLRSIATAQALGARKVVLHPSFVGGMARNVPELALEYALQSLDAAAQEGEKLGCQLCLENLFERLTPFTGVDDFAAAFERWPQMGMTLDVGHAFIDGRGMDRIFAFIDSFADRIRHIHISDNYGRHDDHLRVGEGNVDFEALIKGLKNIPYDDTITLEIFTPRRADLVHSRKQLQRMFSSI